MPEAYQSTEPTPPTGYVLAPGCSDHWIGQEIVSAGWVITPAWNASTNRHSLELWAADREEETYRHLSEADAFDLAMDLIAATKTIHTANDGGPE